MAEAALQSGWAREYETIYILQPGTSVSDADKVASRVAEVVERLGGKLVKVDNWGKRRLAYPIKKATRGIFIYFKYLGQGALVAELERNLRMLDSVIRYQTIVLTKNVDPTSVEIDPEEIKFVPIEITEEEEEPGLAQRLGLADAPQEPDTAAAPQPAEEAEGAGAEAEGEAEREGDSRASEGDAESAETPAKPSTEEE